MDVSSYKFSDEEIVRLQQYRDSSFLTLILLDS